MDIMSHRSPITFQALYMLLGLLPFIGGSILIGHQSYPWLGHIDPLHAVLSYALCIAIFIAGSHWGQSMITNQPNTVFYTSSSLITLILWISYLLCSPMTFIYCLCAGFSLLCLIDLIQWRKHLLPNGYGFLRLVISLLVIALLFNIRRAL